MSSSAGPWLDVFVDESGTPELDLTKRGVTRFYIAVAVFVDDERRKAAEAELERAASELCGGAEIKSSRIGPNHERRLAFLEAVQRVEFGYHALAIDKTLVQQDSGLRFKASFHKFFARMLQGQLDYYSGGLRVTSDSYGNELFMQSLDAYLAERVRPNLFYEYEHRSVPSESSRLVQLADLVAGSLAYWLDPEKGSLYAERFRDLLSPKEAGIVAWPLPPRPARAPASGELDARIEETAVRRAQRLLGVLGESTDQRDRMRAVTLDALLFARMFEEGSRRSIFTDRLLDNLAAHGFERPPKQAFRADIIGGLRDRHIVIAGTSEGYRLALSVEDISDYLSHTQNVVEPMLARVVFARTAVKQDTANHHDILNEGSPVLRSLVETFIEAQVLPNVDVESSGQAQSEDAEDVEP